MIIMMCCHACAFVCDVPSIACDCMMLLYEAITSGTFYCKTVTATLFDSVPLLRDIRQTGCSVYNTFAHACGKVHGSHGLSAATAILILQSSAALATCRWEACPLSAASLTDYAIAINTAARSILLQQLGTLENIALITTIIYSNKY